MKRRHLCLMICLVIVMAVGCLFSLNITVYAEDDKPGTLGYYIPKGMFEDDKLYNALSSVYKNAIKDNEDLDNGGKVYDTMFKHAGIKKLDLSSREISSINDLSYVDLKEIEILDLSFNNLSGEIDLTEMTGLKKINLSNNQLTGVKLTGLNSLEEIILNNNQISSMDLSEIKANKIDLSCNKITSIESITMPAKTGTTVVLVNNNITDATSTVVNGTMLELGVQVDKTNSNKLVMYKLHDANIKVVIEGNNEIISSDDLEGESQVITLKPSTYTIEYKYVADNSAVWQADEFYNIDTIWKAGYKTKEISIKPAAPTYTIYVEGKAQTSTVIHKKGEVKVAVVDDTVAYISFDGENWQEFDGKNIQFDKESKTFWLKSVQNGIESEEVKVSIIYQKEAIPAWLTIILLVLFVIGLITAYWLVKKYIIDRVPTIQE